MGGEINLQFIEDGSGANIILFHSRGVKDYQQLRNITTFGPKSYLQGSKISGHFQNFSSSALLVRQEKTQVQVSKP